MAKKKILLGIAVLTLLFVFLLAGCASTYHYKKDTPVEQQATLKIMSGYLTVTALEEVAVKWKGSVFGSTVYLPAGPHTFTAKYSETNFFVAWLSKTSHSEAAGMHISENILPGHTYTLIPNKVGNSVSLTITDQGTQGGEK